MVLIFDLDGVIYLGDSPIPGALAALRELESAGHRLFFITNNSTRNRRTYAERLTRMGYPAAPEQVMTSAYATALHLAAEGCAGQRALVVGEQGLVEELTQVGIEVAAYEDSQPVDLVVVGLDRELTYAKLLRAHLEISKNGARFVATNRDATYPLEHGEIPGGGAIVAPIECSTGVRPVTIGKPEPHTWRRILEQAGASPGETMMVGDRSETDILGAKQIGLRTALVLSGVTSPEMAAALPKELQAEFVLASVADLPELVQRLSPVAG